MRRFLVVAALLVTASSVEGARWRCLAEMSRPLRNPTVRGLLYSTIILSAPLTVFVAGERDAAQVAARRADGVARRFLPVTDERVASDLSGTFANVATADRLYWESWSEPQVLRWIFKYHAEENLEFEKLARELGVPLDDDAQFLRYLGVRAGTGEAGEKESRPLVEAALPGVIQHRLNVERLIAHYYEGAHRFGQKYHLSDDSVSPDSAVWSFRDLGHRARDFHYVQSQLREPGNRAFQVMATADYLRHEIIRRRDDAGEIFRRLILDRAERREHFETEARRLKISVSLDDARLFAERATGYPYGDNEDFLGLINGALSDVIYQTHLSREFRDTPRTAGEVLDEIRRRIEMQYGRP